MHDKIGLQNKWKFRYLNKIFNISLHKKYTTMNEMFIMYTNQKTVFSQKKSPSQSWEKCLSVF